MPTEHMHAPGPIDFILLEFPDQEPARLVATELMALVNARIIAIYDIVAVRKSTKVVIFGFEISYLGDGEVAFAAFARSAVGAPR